MRVKYGNYTHDINECEFIFGIEISRNDQEVPYDQVVTWRLRGRIIDPTNTNTPVTLGILESALIAAYSTDGFDASLMDNSGNVIRTLNSAGSLHGVQVNGPNFPTGKNAEYVGYRTYSINLRAVYPISISPIIAFSEICRFSGGGPVYQMVEYVNGPPQKQMIREQSAYRAVQQGKIVGRFAYPDAPPPLFPEALLTSPNIDGGTPRRRGNALEGFSVDYLYEFASAQPFVFQTSSYPM